MLHQALCRNKDSCVHGAGNQLGDEVDEAALRNLGLHNFESTSTSKEDQKDGTTAKTPEKGSKASSQESSGAVGVGPFILGESLPVVPEKLVKKILKGDFIDMADLLKDNLEAERRRYSQEQGVGQPSYGQPPYYKREVPDMLSWLTCFSLYAAVITSKYPQKAKELWAYQAMMVSEQRRCGGRGWLLYDSAFRQQISSLEATDFSKINQSLYSTTFLAYGGRSSFCSYCLAADHAQEDCALHPQRGVPVVRFKEAGTPRLGDIRRKRPRRGACFAWNEGKCSAQYCRFDHVCSKCFGDHKRVVCRLNRGESGQGRPTEEPRSSNR